MLVLIPFKRSKRKVPPYKSLKVLGYFFQDATAMRTAMGTNAIQV